MPVRSNMDFGEALQALEAGNRVARAGWNGKGMWLVLIDADEWAPEAYKFFDAERTAPFIAMRTADGALVPWFCSQTDKLAEDWTIVE